MSAFQHIPPSSPGQRWPFTLTRPLPGLCHQPPISLPRSLSSLNSVLPYHLFLVKTLGCFLSTSKVLGKGFSFFSSSSKPGCRPHLLIWVVARSHDQKHWAPPGMLAHGCNPNAEETEAGGSLHIQGWPGLHSDMGVSKYQTKPMTEASHSCSTDGGPQPTAATLPAALERAALVMTASAA